LGHGSEWHTLRYLGRHRRLFTDQILKVIGGDAIVWKDFEFTGGIGENQNYGDAELKGLDFLPDCAVKADWRSWWPQSGNVPNWDAVGVLEHGGDREWVLVEAKGNVEELRQSTKAKPRSQGGGLDLIQQRLAETQVACGITDGGDWTQPFYQYANRLATLQFLLDRGVAARLVFVYFIGDATRDKTCPATSEGWRPSLDAMKSKLGLTGASKLELCVHEVFMPVVQTA